MAYSLLPFCKPHFHANDGGPAVGYRLYSFDSSTSEPSSLFANPDGSGEYGEYVELNARGEPEGMGLYADEDLSYTLVLRTAEGADVWTMTGVTATGGGGGGTTVTMDSIAQGVAYKKMTANQYNGLTSGSTTTLHYHAADRAWANVTGKPTTISGYGITNAYTKTETDAIVGGFVTNTGDDISGQYVISGDAGGQITLLPGIDGSAVTCYLNRGDGNLLYNSVFADQTITLGSHTVDANSQYAYQLMAYEGQAMMKLTAADTNDDSSTLVIERSVSLGGTPREVITTGLTQKTLLYPLGENGTFATREWVVANLPTLTNGYNFTQAYPTNEWTITHNLGYKPVVQAWNSSDDVIIGTVHHVSVNQCTILFSSGQSGGARCV